ncbi:uncharacterized protein ACN427_004402 [Glossina fuscipes fuscipes]
MQQNQRLKISLRQVCKYAQSSSTGIWRVSYIYTFIYTFEIYTLVRFTYMYVDIAYLNDWNYSVFLKSVWALCIRLNRIRKLKHYEAIGITSSIHIENSSGKAY